MPIGGGGMSTPEWIARR